MNPTTITLLFLVFAIVMFILEKIPLGLTATIVAIGLNVTGRMAFPITYLNFSLPSRNFLIRRKAAAML